MDDFASASMLRLLLRAMVEEGLPAPVPLPDSARAPIQDKRLVVSCIVGAGGLPLLWRLAQQVRHIEGEPLHLALANARDPHDFAARWQRLERYVHASHRVLVRHSDDRSLVLEHVARGGASPTSAESVAVLGVWIGALQAIGVEDLRAEIGTDVVHGEGATERWPAAPTGPWRLRWARVAAARAASKHVPEDEWPPGGPWPWPEPAATLANWMAQDPVTTSRVAAAAAALKLPLRTLQRRLKEAGINFSELLGEVRMRRAAAWLARGTPTLAEIGYLCGYADQAHFTREFTRRAGLPPARFRAAAMGLR